ncbi:MAG TPA: hypothetical protein VGF47_01030 [Solirubrobacteraceae bacterium]|jgi:hypothetical protein
MRRHATHDRDNSLRRLSRVNRWLIAGSLTLTGALTEVAAHAFPSSATGSAAPAHAKHKRRRGHNSRPTAHHAPSTSALKPPAHAPEASESSTEPSGEATSEPSAEATHEAAPPAEGSAPAPEAAPEVQTAPEPTHETEASTPVVSGGS